jgi:outer membrane protein OmpA-like peptidoglycan-associated protein
MKDESIFASVFFYCFMRFIFCSALSLIVCFSFAQSLSNSSFERSNTPYDELNPVISPDGRSQYITVANHPENSGGMKDPGDIWVSVLSDDNKWGAPVHAGPTLNDKGYNAVAGFSADGQRMVLLTHYGNSGNTARTQGISVSRLTNGGWSKPENINIPYFQNKSGVLSGYILPDESVFIFSAETYGSRGVEDIYVCTRNGNGSWSEPRNLGGTINTRFQELSPSLSDDGRTLYFSTNGGKGSGSFDIYRATRQDDGWTNWSPPENMGAAINSEGRELYFRPYERQGFALYTSTKNSDGYGDVKIFITGEPQPPDTTRIPPPPDTVRIVEIERQPDADQRLKVYGKVTNAKTGESVNASILFSSPAVTQSSKSTGDGGYEVRIPSTEQYTVQIEAPGFISAMEKLDVQTYEMKELEMNFRLQPLEVGATVNLKDVLFEQGKTVMLSQSYPELDLVVAFLKANPKVRIELSGHTDNRGIPGQNLKLSQARVEKVKDYLVSKGIEKKRITGKGYGGSRPIASNETEETRLLNRRVEFTILKY